MRRVRNPVPFQQQPRQQVAGGTLYVTDVKAIANVRSERSRATGFVDDDDPRFARYYGLDDLDAEARMQRLMTKPAHSSSTRTVIVDQRRRASSPRDDR